MSFLKNSITSLFDNNIPLSDEVLHGEVHLLVVFGLELQLLNIDLLKQVIDVNPLNGAGDLPLELRVFLFELGVLLDQPSVVFGQLLLLDIEHLVLRIQLRVFDSLLDDIFPIVGVGLRQGLQIHLQI